MQDYKILTEDDQYFLACYQDSGELKHRITMPDSDTAHQYRLALGLGTHPTPLMNHAFYRLIGEDPRTFDVVVEFKAKEDDSQVSTCCHSGCPNCPWS
jgi:hypothetical protein